MRQSSWVLSVAFLFGLFLWTVNAEAQVVVIEPPDVTISVGYSNLQTQKANNLFYSHDGAYIDADFAWRLPVVVPLDAGFGITGSSNWDRQPIGPAASDFYDPYDHLYSNVGLLEFEPRISLRLGRETGFFAVPRIGAGLLINSYSIDQSLNSGGNTYLTTSYHTGAAFEVRPDIRAGYSWGRASAGIEASYLYGTGDFGGLGHNAQEYRIGAFVTFRY